MLVTLKQLLDHAKENSFGVGAFNINNLEQCQAVLMAAVAAKSPVIIQASRGALQYTNMVYLQKMIEAAVELNPEIPVVLHLDHGNTLESVQQAIDLGFTSVMIDASHHDFEENVRITKEVVDYAHARGVSVEAELGTLGGIEEDIVGTVCLTDPAQAEEFVKRTGVDCLAVAIGTSHGAAKSAGNTGEVKLAVELVGKISERVGIPLVMHGASCVPQDLVQEINSYGGALNNAAGVDIEDIKKCVARGISKINQDSDLRLCVTATVRGIFNDKPEVFDPRHYLGPARQRMADMMEQRMKEFGCAGHADDKIEWKTLEQAKKDYYGL